MKYLRPQGGAFYTLNNLINNERTDYEKRKY